MKILKRNLCQCHFHQNKRIDSAFNESEGMLTFWVMCGVCNNYIRMYTHKIHEVVIRQYPLDKIVGSFQRRIIALERERPF